MYKSIIFMYIMLEYIYFIVFIYIMCKYISFCSRGRCVTALSSRRLKSKMRTRVYRGVQLAALGILRSRVAWASLENLLETRYFSRYCQLLCSMVSDQTRFRELSEEYKHDNQSASRTAQVIPTFSDLQQKVNGLELQEC